MGGRPAAAVVTLAVRRGRSLLGLAAALGAVLLTAGLALAAEPAASPAVVVVAGGDPRSEGAGPGLVGSPLLVLAAVVVLGIVTALVTLLVARLVQRP